MPCVEKRVDEVLPDSKLAHSEDLPWTALKNKDRRDVTRTVEMDFRFFGFSKI